MPNETKHTRRRPPVDHYAEAAVQTRVNANSELRQKLHKLIDQILDVVFAGGGGFYDQSNSPLGRAKHLAYARQGKIASFKEGRSVFMKRGDVDAYIERHRTWVFDETLDEEAQVARMMAHLDKRTRDRAAAKSR